MQWRIGIIDDNKDARETLGEFFRGVSVTLFESCEEALREMDKGTRFDAVVTDTDLGKGLDGFGCTKEIRSRNPKAVILGTSAISEWDDPGKEEKYRTLYLRLGADGFVNKSDGAEKIVAVVAELLRGRK